MKNTLEDLLHKMGLAPERIAEARKQQESGGGSLRERLIAQGVLTQEGFAKKVSQLLRVPYMDVADKNIPDAVLQLLPRTSAEKYLALPVELDEKHRRITIAMAAPSDMQTLDELKFVIGHTLIPHYSPEDELRDHIPQYYTRLEENLLSTASRIGQPELPEDSQHRFLDVERLLDADRPILQLLGRVLSVACARGAHEIRLKAGPEHAVLEFILDGKAAEFIRFPEKLHKQFVSCLKRELGIELKEPSDLCSTGFCTLKPASSKTFGLSYQIYKSFYGGECLLKLKNRVVSESLPATGLPAGSINMLRDALDAGDGAILLSGTTRSGLTNSLYSFLSLINRSERNILSIEAPVEYQLEGVSQGQTSGEAERSYEFFARTLLKQSPDVLMVDHIFDANMAELLLQLASGSLVLSSLIATDTAAAFMKLSALTTPELASERVRCFSAQRLLRTICGTCKEQVVLADAFREKLGLESQDECYVGKGCEQCGQSGYKGFVPIFEWLPLTETSRQILRESQTVQDCRNLLLQKNTIRSLRDSGMEKVRQGVTTVQEVIRTTIV
ncbi:MAG: Flp pilus assembly complex ATPase component [bacterium]|nr:Flp pilus assembly complex ATPase component [bacterium]